MRSALIVTTCLSLLSSCSFDGLFLFPYKLANETKVSRYSSTYEDTISVSFQATQPQFTNSKNELIETDFTVTSINFPDRFSDTINAWLIEPKENFNGQILYFLHGNAGNILYQYSLTLPLVKRGYKVFMIDYSGFGFSQGESTRKAILTDAYDGFEYLLRRTDLERNGIIIYGQSLGGHLSVVVAKKYH